MTKNKLTNSSLVINLDASIEEAMGAITDNQRGSVVVVNDDFVLSGIVADGDIRRAMLKGATRMAPVSKMLNMSPTIITESEAKDGKGKEVFEENSAVNILPVVNNRNVVVDVLIRDPKVRKFL